MKKYFSIGEAAKMAGMTCETLRHYDRIGLVSPGKKDEWTGYRYYTEQDVVLLQTVKALQQLGLPLKKMKEVLVCDDLRKVLDFLEEAEQKADEKIAALQHSKAKIRFVRQDYEKKLMGQQRNEQMFVTEFPERVILLSDSMESPTLDNLWNYLAPFYEQVDPALRENFAFADLAGIYTEGDLSRMFAICTRYEETAGLRRLPAGEYLCADCTESDRAETLNKLLQTAKEQYQVSPRFALQMIVISGIVQWKYQIQVCLKK